MSKYKLTWVLALTLTLGLLISYLLFSIGSFLGEFGQSRYLFLFSLFLFITLFLIFRKFFFRGSISELALHRFTLLSSVTLISLVGLDTAYGLYSNALKKEIGLADRESDGVLWYAELTPNIFYPTQRNFFIHKPQQKMAGYIYGDFYYPGILRSRTIRNHVLQKRYVSFSIDEYGFRETTPLQDARIFVLGDSFAKGVETDQSKIWPELLERAVQQPVYNLGMESTSPYQQLLLLEYLLEKNSDSIQIKDLLWLIFEGNDLEDSYDELSTIERQDNEMGTKVMGTVLYPIVLLPHTVEKWSVLNQLLTRKIAASSTKTTSNSPYEIDRIKLAYPLYHSPQYGYSFFAPDSIKRASSPQSYVMEHPHKPQLERTFNEMATLSAHKGFKVTVLIVPTSVRLYAFYFDGLAGATGKPYFINLLEELSKKHGFQVLNLHNLFAPYAKKELLYYRDDSHWNERGHEVVAEIVAREVQFAH